MSEAQKTDITGERLKQFVQRYEKLQEEIDTLKDDQKDIMKEAKSAGFDTKILKQVIREHKKDRTQRQEEQELLETYLAAIGLD